MNTKIGPEGLVDADVGEEGPGWSADYAARIATLAGRYAHFDDRVNPRPAFTGRG